MNRCQIAWILIVDCGKRRVGAMAPLPPDGHCSDKAARVIPPAYEGFSDDAKWWNFSGG